MPNVVRFVLSSARTLSVPGAGQFVNGVLDVDANKLDLVARTRFLVMPYQATEIGIVDSATPPPALPAVPAAPNPDPYPQYLLPSEVANDPTVRAAFGRRAVAYGDPSSEGNGTPSALASGQAVQSFGVAPIVVTSGQYRHTPNAAPNSAGYLQADLGARVGRIGVDAIWPSGATGGIALVLPTARWDQGSFPEAGIHFVMYRNAWHISHWNGAGEDLYAQGTFTTALDDGVPHRVEIVLDGATAYLNFPDGSTVRVDDARINSKVSTWAIWELYEGNGATDAAARLSAVWADKVPAVGMASATPQEVALTRSRVQLPATYTVGAPGSAATTAITTGEVEVARSTLTIPKNFKQWVRCAAYLELTGATQVYYQIRVTTVGGGGGQFQWQQLVLDGGAGVKGTYSAERAIDLSTSGFTVGDSVDVVWNVWGTAASAGQVVADANRGKTMHLTPVA